MLHHCYDVSKTVTFEILSSIFLRKCKDFPVKSLRTLLVAASSQLNMLASIVCF